MRLRVVPKEECLVLENLYVNALRLNYQRTHCIFYYYSLSIVTIKGFSQKTYY